MCLACEQVTPAVLDALTREVMLAEAEAGLGDASAHRPLSDAERRAQVRFGEIAALEEDYLDEVTPLLADLLDVVTSEVAAALAGVTTAAALVDALEGLVRSQPAAVATVAQDVAGAVETALDATYTGASETVIREAERQGVRALPAPREAEAGRFAAVAQRVAAEPWRRALTVLETQVATPGNLATAVLPDDLVPMALSGLNTDGAVDLARQASHGAINGGRLETAEALNPQERYSSELLDSNTCANCRAEDGRTYATRDEAEAAYPSGGGFRDCSGGARCRGTIVYVY